MFDAVPHSDAHSQMLGEVACSYRGLTLSAQSLQQPCQFGSGPTLFLWLPQDICFLLRGGHGTKKEANSPRHIQGHAHEIHQECVVWGGMERQSDGDRA